MTAVSTRTGVVFVDLSRPLGDVPTTLYGHFIEQLSTMVNDGVGAELLYGRRFEAPMVDKRRHLPAAPWEPFGDRTDGVAFLRAWPALGRYSLPHARAHHSQAVQLVEGHDGGERGLAQRDVSVGGGVRYRFRARVRRLGGGVAGFTVALRTADGAEILAAEEFFVDEPAVTRPGFLHDPARFWMDDRSWADVSCVLVPSTSDAAAWLTLTLSGGPGTVWFDAVSLMAEDAVDGLELGVVNALRDIGVPLLKWPGGCFADGYDWRLGVGPRDDRYPAFDQAWCAWEENDIGTDEFLRLCEVVGAEPFLGVNAGSGTPELARAWVEYANGDTSTRFGALRASYGRPEPYGVRYWCIGNEQWGWFERGFDGVDGYAARVRDFAAAMRSVDPSIVVVACGEPGEFTRGLLAIAGDVVDLVSVHSYSREVEPGDAADATAKIVSAQRHRDVLARTREDIAAAGFEDRVRVAFDEWGFCRDGHAGAAYAAWALIEQQRAAPLVVLGARTGAVNVDGLVTRDGRAVAPQSAAHAYRLFMSAHRGTAVTCDVSGDALLAASALVDQRGVSVMLANAGDRPIDIALDGIHDEMEVREVRPGPDGPWGPSSWCAPRRQSARHPLRLGAYAFAAVSSVGHR